MMSAALLHDDCVIELIKTKPPKSIDWNNCPSNNYRDIELELYLRISKTPFTVVEQNYPYSTITNNDLPCIRYDVDVIQYNNAIQWLQNNVVDLDTHRSRDELNEIRAFKSLIHNELIPASEYIEWCVEENYKTLTRYTYTENVAFPVNKVLNYYKKQRVIKQSAISNINSLADATRIIESVYDTLYSRLHNKPNAVQFYPGKLISTLDVLLCSVITLHLHIPLPINPAKQYLTKKPALLKFSQHIMTTYFPTTASIQHITSPIKALPVDEQIVRKKVPVKRSDAINKPVTAEGNTNDESDGQKPVNLLVFTGIASTFLAFLLYQRTANSTTEPPTSDITVDSPATKQTPATGTA